jgi:hypothetical protein
MPRESAKVRGWLREDPVFAAMTSAVVRVRRVWPGVLAVAHRDERTGRVTFHLHVRAHDRQRLHDLLGPVQLNEMHDGPAVTYHFQGDRQDMARLLHGLGPAE